MPVTRYRIATNGASRTHSGNKRCLHHSVSVTFQCNGPVRALALSFAALAMVMGGAVGNLLDRARLGYVIDYVDMYWGPTVT